MSNSHQSFPSALDERTSENEGSRPVRILLVEDHANSREAMQHLLSRAGFTVATAGSVSEALSAASSFDPDLLLSDIGLPDGDGYEVLERLREIHPGLAAIAVTAYSDRNDEPHANFTEYLSKPIQYPKLLRAIREAIA